MSSMNGYLKHADISSLIQETTTKATTIAFEIQRAKLNSFLLSFLFFQYYVGIKPINLNYGLIHIYPL